MIKPHYIPQDVWDAVKGVAGVGGGHEMQGYKQAVLENAARLLIAEREVTDEAIGVLSELLSVLRREAPGTALNNHKYDQLGIRAYDVISKASRRTNV